MGGGGEGVWPSTSVCDCVSRADGAELTEDGKTRGDLSRERVSEAVWGQQGVAAVLRSLSRTLST